MPAKIYLCSSDHIRISKFFMFTQGRIIFAVLFFIAFVGLMFYAYRKDLKINRSHFPKSYKILLVIILIISILFFIVKFKSLVMN